MNSSICPRVLAAVAVLSLLSACGGSGGGTATEGVPSVVVQSIPASEQRVIPTEESRPYRAEGRYASVLKECALADTEGTCTLAVLPYIGQSGQRPSIEDIMQRVVVTHDWMGARFELMLARMPADILDLFAPVTSILIGSEVRPSSYSAVKARIRIDPVYLWLSLPEKRTIDNAPDFRTEFGAALQFRAFWRLAIGNNYATTYSTLSDDNEREIDELDISLARLLYHELAHANDFIQYDDLSNASVDNSPGQAADALFDTQVWRALYDDEQLTAQTSYLYGLAAVRYFDEAPSDFQASIFAEFVGTEMGNEGKMTFYGYSSVREDVATLFASAMMKYHYDVEYHVGFVNKPQNDADASCNDYKVAWGVRNRLASGLVAPRAQLVVDKMLRPSANRDQFFASELGVETSLRLGAGWCESVSDEVELAKQYTNMPAPQELDVQ